MTRTRMAVIGCGHLGAIHARLLAARSDVELVAVVDPSSDAASRAADAHGCQSLCDPFELPGLVDAAIVAAPTGLHATIAVPLLEAGIDVLIEKPVAASLEDAERIVAVAARCRRIVAVGHVERFNPAWQVARRILGRATVVEAKRLAPFSYRSLDVGAVLDLMIHDIDLVLSLGPGRVMSIEAQGLVAVGGHEDAVRARVRFADGLVADFFASRINPVLDRSIMVWSDRSLVTVDFTSRRVEMLEPSEAVRHGRFAAAAVPPHEWAERRESFFREVIPQSVLAVPEGNALVDEHDDFLKAVRDRGRPTVTADDGLAALTIACGVLEAVSLTRFAENPWPAVQPRRHAA